jgi:hypothetical protein
VKNLTLQGRFYDLGMEERGKKWRRIDRRKKRTEKIVK